jgi:hypothetical protein
MRTLASLLLVSCLVNTSFSLSSVADRSQLARSRLQEALSSPSGKLTLSPEIIIPDPTEPTAILLQTSAIQALSETVRSCKANAAFIDGSTTAVNTFLMEQEKARGSFPGPVPVVYCSSDCTDEELEQLSEAGAAGLSVTMTLDSFGDYVDICKRAMDNGLQPIPEVIISQETAESWTEEDVASLVETLTSTFDMEPVSVLLTVEPSSSPSSESSNDEDDDQQQVTLPPVSKELSKKLPILGSVNVPGEIAAETARFKEAGFTGSVLRASCLPTFRTPDLEPVARFWGACISDLKSTRSKSFSFRAKNKMEKSVMNEWAKYSQDVVESGAIGDLGADAAEVDSEAGEYKGF